MSFLTQETFFKPVSSNARFTNFFSEKTNVAQHLKATESVSKNEDNFHTGNVASKFFK